VRRRHPEAHLALERRFEAVVLDWDGTAVPDRRADAGRVRHLFEALSRAGFDIAVVSGTNVDNVDGQLAARPAGPGELHLCLNRGSEVFAVGPAGPRVVHRRVATAEEDAALTRAAELAVERLAHRGLEARIVSERLNRRKIDLIPEPAWADPPKARIDELVLAVTDRLAAHGVHGLPGAVEIARRAAADAGLADARVTSDAKHVEIGLTDKSDSARWILEHVRLRGLRPRDMLLAGDEFGQLGGVPGSDSLMLVSEAAGAAGVSVGVEPGGVPPGVIALGGGPDALLDVLEQQLRRRTRRELPHVPDDQDWTLAIEGIDPELERAHEAMLTLADGAIGTNGSLLLAHPATAPRVLAMGLYDGEGTETELLPCPVWTQLAGELEPSDRVQRLLDLRTGLLHQQLSLREGVLRAVLFSSAARPGTVALRVEGPAQRLQRRGGLAAPLARGAQAGGAGRRRWLCVAASHGGVVAAVAESRLSAGRKMGRLDRVGTYVVDHAALPEPVEAVEALREVEQAGFERLLVEHRATWARRWEEADVVIEGDPELQFAVRFSLFHLMASVPDSGEAALGARGLSGPAYRGHVFWDSDVFVLPSLAATHPAAARALLEYRVRRLLAAREAARRSGRAGARFPWESAGSGFDVTPPLAYDRTGRVIPIRTGELEEHIVADIAWAASCYLDWTGDEEFGSGSGLTLLVETARYWASRIRLDQHGGAHIDGVIGPDEYHGRVDDNAYTNGMARWNLRYAAHLAAAAHASGVDAAERDGWLAVADALVDGYDASTGLYEQFAGFFALEPLVIEEIAPRRPVAADALLGHDRVRAAQVVKQADVLMLHHLLPDEVAPGSLEPNLAFYEPRTAHGSSLSPGIHAALLARTGRTEQALAALRLASRIDLDDLTQTTAGGLHMAAMGSVWQALAFGFAGVRPGRETLRFDPHLPDAWQALELRLRHRGSVVRVRIEPGELLVHANPPLAVRVGDGDPIPVGPAGIRLQRRAQEWTEGNR